MSTRYEDPCEVLFKSLAESCRSRVAPQYHADQQDHAAGRVSLLPWRVWTSSLILCNLRRSAVATTNSKAWRSPPRGHVQALIPSMEMMRWSMLSSKPRAFTTLTTQLPAS